MTSTKKRILLTCGRSFLTLDLARHFKDFGYDVFVADSHRYHLCRFSNAFKKSFRVPSPRFDGNNYIDALVKIVKKHHIDYVIPVFEEIFTLSQGLGLFPKSCRVLCESQEKLLKLHDKWLFNKTLLELGFKAPRSHLITNLQDLKELSIDRPYILKPCYSRAATQVHKFCPGDSLPRLIFPPNNPWIAQEFVEGEKFCSYSICHEGKLTGHSLYPVKFTIKGSNCLTFEAIEHPGIYQWIENFVKKYHFSGQISFDFIISKSGEIHVIECNPRATSGLHLFAPSDSLDKAFFTQVDSPISPTSGKKRQISMGMLLYGWRGGKLKDFLKAFLLRKDVVFAWKDLKPFFSQPLIFVDYIINSWRRGLTLVTYFTHDIDWNNEI